MDDPKVQSFVRKTENITRLNVSGPCFLNLPFPLGSPTVSNLLAVGWRLRMK